MQEGRLRSLYKAISWRITATLITIFASFIIIGDITPALSIGFIEFLAKLGVYYGHERAWVYISLGRRKLAPISSYRSEGQS